MHILEIGLGRRNVRDVIGGQDSCALRSCLLLDVNRLDIGRNWSNEDWSDFLFRNVIEVDSLSLFSICFKDYSVLGHTFRDGLDLSTDCCRVGILDFVAPDVTDDILEAIIVLLCVGDSKSRHKSDRIIRKRCGFKLLCGLLWSSLNRSNIGSPISRVVESNTLHWFLGRI